MTQTGPDSKRPKQTHKQMNTEYINWGLNRSIRSFQIYRDEIKAECLAFIRANDRNGFETLDGNESIEDLLAAVESIKNQ